MVMSDPVGILVVTIAESPKDTQQSGATVSDQTQKIRQQWYRYEDTTKRWLLFHWRLGGSYQSWTKDVVGIK